MRQCKIFISTDGAKKLIDEEVGYLGCWRGGHECSSRCVAWRESHRKITCMALPKNKNTSNIIAILKKEKRK